MLASFVQDLFVVLHFGAALALVLMLVRPSWREAFARRCVGSSTAVDLAWVRIVTCGTLIVYVFTENLASQALLGPAWFDPPGFTRWLGRGWLEWFLSGAFRLQALTVALLGALALGLVGLFTRFALPAAALLYFVFAALLRAPGKLFHDGYLGFYALLALCFLPAGDAWSLDARRRPPPPRPRETYAWSVYACWAAVAIPYLQLGFSKLIDGGLTWWEGVSVRNYMLMDNLNLHDLDLDLAVRFWDAPLTIFSIIGLFGLLTELAYPFVLVSSRLRRILPACVALVHVGVWVAQDLLFVDATLMPLIFFRPRRRR